MLRRLILASVACAAVLGCGLVYDTGKLGAEPDGSDAGDAAAAMDDDSATMTVEAANGCPSGKGPSMVRIDDFCIDSTEVTGEQYARFVMAVGAESGGPAGVAQCIANTTLTPAVTMGFPAPPPETLAFPVHGVDWCDAKAYCRWAGKDLCGGLGGKTLTSADATDPQKSQWEKACTKNGTKRFGYSDSYSAGKCVDGEKPIRPANGTCEGGYAGLFDLVGNVAEWIDACQAPLDSQAPCALMGSSPGPDEIASCTSADTVQGTIPWTNAGIRCCAPAPP